MSQEILPPQPDGPPQIQFGPGRLTPGTLGVLFVLRYPNDQICRFALDRDAAIAFAVNVLRAAQTAEFVVSDDGMGVPNARQQ